jgi:hypothetical protein
MEIEWAFSESIRRSAGFPKSLHATPINIGNRIYSSIVTHEILKKSIFHSP